MRIRSRPPPCMAPRWPGDQADKLAHPIRRFRGGPQVVKLKSFSKFDNTAEALQAAASLVDSKLSKGVRGTLLRCQLVGCWAPRRAAGAMQLSRVEDAAVRAVWEARGGARLSHCCHGPASPGQPTAGVPHVLGP